MRHDRVVGDAPVLLSLGGRGLAQQIAWFNRLRFTAALAMLGLTFVAARGGLLVDPAPLYALGAATVALDGIYVWWARGNAERSVRTLRRHVDLQIGVDLAILTALLHYSGGITNPMVLAYLFHTLIAAFLLSLRAAVAVAVLSIVLVGALGWLEFRGILTHHPLGLELLHLQRMRALDLVLWIATIALVLAASIYLVSTIVRQLGRRDQELVGLSRQLALSEKLASVGTLAAGVSHEINNPVSVIRQKTDILRYRIGDGDPPARLLTELDTIQKHTQRIAAITDGLLAFARETPFELQPVSVNELVQEGADLVRVPFKSAELGLDVSLAPERPSVSGSPNHLLQVLVNVLLNARDASPADSRVAISTACDRDEVRIQIEDRGVGIPEQLLDKIFDPFFTTKDVGRGTGLGLALSHGIVERHGGRIEVESVLGAGTAFRVVLPRLGAGDGA